MLTVTAEFFFFSDLDKFTTDDIMDPIAKAKMVALKGINRVLAQDPMVVPPGINRYLFNLTFLFLNFLSSCCNKPKWKKKARFLINKETTVQTYYKLHCLLTSYPLFFKGTSFFACSETGLCPSHRCRTACIWSSKGITSLQKWHLFYVNFLCN